MRLNQSSNIEMRKNHPFQAIWQTAVVLLLMHANASAQSIEEIIPLPNSAAPRDMLYNPIDNKIYSANTPDLNNPGAATESVCIIDGATNDVIRCIPMKKGSRDFCHNTTDNKVYVANYFADSVTIIDGKTDSVLAIIPVGDGPRALTYNSVNNRIYCANEASGDVTVIDGKNNNVITTTKVGQTPRVICYNPISNKIYVPNAGSGNLSIINGETNAVIATVRMGNVPRGIVFNPQSNRVYVTNYSSDNVSVVDGITDSVVATIPVGDGPTAIFHNPEGNKIYCSNVGAPGPDTPDECTVSIIDASTNNVIKTLTTGDEPTAFCFASRSKRIYWANEWSHDIAIVDASADTFIKLIKYQNPPVTPVDICYNPQDTRLYTANRFKLAVGVILDSLLTTTDDGLNQFSAIRVYPNPVSDVLHMDVLTKYQILSHTGELVLESSVATNAIDVSPLPKGTYLLVTDRGTMRFVKI